MLSPFPIPQQWKYLRLPQRMRLLSLKLPPFFTYLFLYSDQILKAFWCFLRLRSGKWIKHVQGTADFGEIEEDEEEIR